MTMNLTRRTFGLAALSAPAVLAATTPLPALAQQGGSAPGGVFSADLGRFEITAIFDGMVPLTTELFFGVDAALVQAELERNAQTGPALPVPVNAFLLKSEDQTILIDAGLGSVDGFGPGLGQLSNGLSAQGVAPEDVDMILLTHAHPDHLGGMIDTGGAVFPNAEVVLTQIEYDFWTDAAVMAQVDEGTKGLFALAQNVFAAYKDRLKLVGPNTEVAKGLRMELSPGHTPGHAVVHIDGGDTQLLMVADTLHNPELHAAFPNIGFGFDTDTTLAAQSRVSLFDRAAEDKILIAASHGHFPGFARIGRDGDAYRYVPASWI